MDVETLDVIQLKDGRIGTVVSCYKDHRFFTIDVETADGEWDLYDVGLDSIETVLWRCE